MARFFYWTYAHATHILNVDAIASAYEIHDGKHGGSVLVMLMGAADAMYIPPQDKERFWEVIDLTLVGEEVDAEEEEDV